MRGLRTGVPILLLLAAASAAGARADRLSDREADAVRRAVRDEMRRQQVVGVAVGFLRDGRLAYTEGFGHADLDRRVALTDRTVVNWASNSKPVMAVLALQLAERGDLDLDADIRRYAPEYPATGHPITTRQLLCHQSGIPHYRNGTVVGTDRTFDDPLPYRDPLNALHKFDRSPLLFAPGAKDSYSSYAYVLLSAVVQEAGGRPIAEQLQRRVVRPLGLRSLQLDLPYSGQPDWSRGYTLTDGRPVAIGDTAHYWKHGAGGYKSDVRDFARWAQALMNGELLKPETLTAMWTAQRTNGGRATTRGLGVTVERQNGRLKISHNGSQGETRTRMVLYPAARNGAVVLCNTNPANPGRFSTAVYSAVNSVR